MAAALTLDQALDDLCSRFLINLPPEERSDLIRICFRVEESHWYYADFYQEKNPHLPKFSLEEFLRKIFQHWTPLNYLVPRTKEIFDKFIEYKYSVPVFGAILLDSTCEQILMVKGWGPRGAWGFPKGKVNKNESEVHCAIREVREETSYDISPLVRETDYINVTNGKQEQRYFIVVGASTTFEYAPRTRKEIGEIAWHRLADLPTKKDSSRKGFFNVLAPLKKLRKWIKDNRPAPPAKFAVPMYQPMQLPPPLGSTAAAASAGSTSPWVDPAIASSGLAAGAAASPAGPGLLPFDGAALLRSLQQASPATSAADGPPPTSAPARSSSPRTESAPFAFPPTSGAVLGPCSDMESFRFDYGDILQGLKSQLTL